MVGTERSAMLGLRSLTIVGVLVLLSAAAFGQGICIPDPVEVERVQGTVLFEAGGTSRPLSDVTVAISPYTGSNLPPVASAVTASDGHFSISSATPGRYWLSVRHKTLIGFSAELRLRPGRNRATVFLIVTIRNDPNKPCGGGTVQLSPALDETCRSLEYQDQNQIDYGPLKVRRIEGWARDMQSTPVPGTCIGLFTEPNHRLVSSVETDDGGRFAFGNISPGRYRLMAKYDHLGIANGILEVAGWPSGGILKNRGLIVHLRPNGIDTGSYVDWKADGK